MFNHYLATSLRHFRQHKLTTTINVVCLAIGLTCFFSAHWLVSSSRSADTYFPNADRIFVITQKASALGSGAGVERPVTGWIAASYLKTDFPELETIARASDGNESGEDEMPVAAGDAKAFMHIRYADPEFLDVFALPFLAGDAKNALRQPHSAIVTEDTAKRLFGGKTQAMRRTVLIQNRYEVVITGVIAKIKSPSHMDSDSQYRFDLLVSMDVYEARAQDDARRQMALREWAFSDVLTYVVLPRGGSLTPAMLKARLVAFGDRHVPAQATSRIEFGATPVSGINMNQTIGTDKAGISMKGLLYVLGALVLMISCLNYANLATAQAATHIKEVGLRRVVGASRSQLMTQHLFESGLQSLAGLLVAAIVISVALTILQPSGLGFVVGRMLSSFAFWILLIAVWGVVTVSAGAYPAFVLSHALPIQAVRAGHAKSGSRFLSSLLVGSQFVGASFLLTAVLVMTKQNAALTRSAFEGMTDPVVILRNNIKDAGVDFDVLRAELSRQPHVVSVTGSAIAPWSAGVALATIAMTSDPAVRSWPVNNYVINHDFFSTLGLKLLAGRAFDHEHANDVTNPEGDTTSTHNIVIDRVAAEQWGWPLAQDAVGKTIYTSSGNSAPATPLQIVGVVEPKMLTLGGNASSLYTLSPQRAFIPSVRISKSDVPAALAEIDAVWNKLAPNVPMKRQFADEVWNSLYRYIVMLTSGFAAIAALAIANSLLGMIGVSMLTIGRRTREIGVRKTLGASVTRILAMLLQDASKPVVIGNLIAWPLAFLAMQVYLNLFAYRTALSPLPFVLTLVVTVFIAWLAVVVQATKAARTNPAMVLRHDWE
jgi:putative ABC transport system permease protein